MPWTVSHQALLSMGFSREEYWSGLPRPSPGDLPYPGIEPTFPALTGRSFTTEPSGKPPGTMGNKLRSGCGVQQGTSSGCNRECVFLPFFAQLAESAWTNEPGRLQSMGLLTVRHDWATSLSLFIFMHWRRKWQPTPVFLPGDSQGLGSLVGCRLWGRIVRHDWSDLAAAAAAAALQIIKWNRMGHIVWAVKVRTPMNS